MRLEGTNAQQVQGICELIEGIACNYPDGMERIRQTVERLTPKPVQVSRETFAVPATATLAGPPARWIPEPHESGPEGWPIPEAEPEADSRQETPSQKRRPGRPKGSKNKARS